MSERSFAVVLSARVDAYVAAMDQAKKATTGFSDSTSKNMTKVGQQMQQVGAGMTKYVTLPIAGAAAAGLKLGMDFETVFSRMAGLADVPAREIDGLKQRVLALAGETATAPQQLAEALYEASSAGLDASQAMAAVEVAATGQAAGLGSAADLVGLVASATASYGADAITAAEATDILTQTIRAGRADPAELAGTLGRILPVAAQLGITFDQVGGATAYLSNVFGDTNRTVTSMSGLMTKMVSPTKTGREALQQMGTSVEELHAALSERGLMGALDLLREKGFAENQQALRALFDDVEAFQGALTLVNDRSGTLNDTMAQVANHTGALGDAFDTATSTDSFRLRQAMTDLTVAATQVGGVLLPMAADIVGPLAEGFAELVGAVMDLPAPLRGIVLGLAGAAAAAGPLLMVGGSLVRNFESMKGGVEMARLGLQRLGLSAGAASGALGVLSGIAVAAGVAFVAYQAFTAKQREVNERAREVASGLDAATDAAIRNAETTSETAVAHAALSAVLTETGDDGEKLTKALGSLGLTTADALPTLVALGKDPVAALKELAMQAGVAADEAQLLAEYVAESDDPFWGDWEQAGPGPAPFAWLTDELKAVGKSMEEVQDQAEKTNLTDIVGGYLNRSAAVSELNQQLLAQAEAETGLSRRGNELLPLYERYVALLDEHADASEASADGSDQQASALDDQAASARQVAAGYLDMNTLLATYIGILDSASNSANGFRQALDKVFGAATSLTDAEENWAAGIDALTKSFKDNGATIDINTEKGRANRDQVQRRVEGLKDYVVALVQSGHSLEDATAAGEMLRAGLVGQMTDLGLTTEEVEGLLAAYGLTPDSIETSVKIADFVETQERLTEMLDAVDEIPEEVETEVSAMIARGEFDEAERRINALKSAAAGGATVRVGATTGAGGHIQASAAGRFVDGPMLSLIGEAGAEVVLPLTRPDRMRALLSDPRVLPSVLRGLGVGAFANGGIIGRVVNAPSAATSGSQRGLMSAMHEVGDISDADYRAFLAQQIDGLEQYSDEWMQVWREIRSLDDQAAAASRDRLAEEDRLQAAMLETGAISAAAYEVYLSRRLASYETYSADWMRIWQQMQQIQAEEQRQAEDALRSTFDRAAATRALSDAERDLADAIGAKDKAMLAEAGTHFDRNAKAEDRERAREQSEAAKLRVAEVAFRGAQARAAANGLQSGTREWAQFVRGEVENYAGTQEATIANELRRLLGGIPQFASGGFIPATPGGRIINVAERGQGEWVVPSGKVTAFAGMALGGQLRHAVQQALVELAPQLQGGPQDNRSQTFIANDMAELRALIRSEDRRTAQAARWGR